MAFHDRRLKRSSDLVVALHYQLAQVRRDGELDAIVVADGSGLPMAGAGAWAACEELAAYAPLLTRTDEAEANHTAPARLAELRPEVDVKSVEVAGETFLLCARGGRTRTSAIDRAAEGVARIFRSAASAPGARSLRVENFAGGLRVPGLDLQADAGRRAGQIRHDARRLRVDHERADPLELEPLARELRLGDICESGHCDQVFHRSRGRLAGPSVQ
jgi:hypothetical protein